ncbi:hypothetical protein PIB30_009011 [Stylosanthes scabra]|uniref:Uncharacterized protein n=1 Tax=Stylosanthes scabra TaxID=79078 RepID=A0ABU6T4X7_9FABA|nr:hypothetical protein [Stylosanthes scabra]
MMLVLLSDGFLVNKSPAVTRPLVGPEASQRSWSILPGVRWSPENGTYLAIVQWVCGRRRSSDVDHSRLGLPSPNLFQMILSRHNPLHGTKSLVGSSRAATAQGEYRCQFKEASGS